MEKLEKLAFGSALGSVMQVSFVVEDIESEMRHWTRTLGVGPFFYLPHFPLVEARYRGEPLSLDLDVALAFSGITCFELIRQNGDTRSPFRDHVAKRGYGFHHFGIPTRRFDADVEARQKDGMTLTGSATVAIGGRCAYLDAPSGTGATLELIEITPPVEEFFGMIHAAAQAWDGSEPVRRLGP